jgi:hypothetical protein
VRWSAERSRWSWPIARILRKRPGSPTPSWSWLPGQLTTQHRLRPWWSMPEPGSSPAKSPPKAHGSRRPSRDTDFAARRSGGWRVMHASSGCWRGVAARWASGAEGAPFRAQSLGCCGSVTDAAGSPGASGSDGCRPTTSCIGERAGARIWTTWCLCSAHHRLIHEGGWRISGHPGEDLRFHDPGGRPLRARLAA